MVFFREKWKKCLSHISRLTVRVDDIFLAREDCKRKRLIKEFTYHLWSNKKLWPQFKKGQMFIFVTKVTYLEYSITAEGVSPILAKVEPIIIFQICQQFWNDIMHYYIKELNGNDRTVKNKVLQMQKWRSVLQNFLYIRKQVNL